MALDASHPQRLGPPPSFDFGPHATAPTFTNPWTASSQHLPSVAHSGEHLYLSDHHTHHGLSHNIMAAKSHVARPSIGSLAPLASFASLSATNNSNDLVSINRLQTNPGHYAEHTFSASASPMNGSFTPASVGTFDSISCVSGHGRSAAFGADSESHPRERLQQQPSLHTPAEERRSFADALDAGHGILAMSQETPRNIYDSRHERSSVDSYGFPAAHSTTSSISSGTNYSALYGGDSVSDYSTAGSDIESVKPPILPRPHSLVSSSIPPAPQSMMGQFSSKVFSGAQKKHKCKVCDKRFTRPSSLQTHMYSHTGEKPLICEIPGCGRQFSVVSNLRRHQKVHRGVARSEAGSEDRNSE